MIIIKKNRLMCSYLKDLEALNRLSIRGYIFEVLDLVASPIIEHDQCLVIEKFVEHSTSYSSHLHYDKTGYECFINHIHVRSFISSRKFNPLLSLKLGILIAEMLSQKIICLKKEELFNLIISYDGLDCSVRFHKVRENENWLNDDLESYTLDGIYLIKLVN